ncbi:MAG TPA: hypothetical protein VFR85_13505 [Anaeromyxobacteraceae bacterium]|nr:hypothetical protein [Anaeromyxobacteraceae bacterium]
MNLSRLLLAVPVVALAACGGNEAQQAFLDAAPSYSALAMDEVAGDSTAPSTNPMALTAPQAPMPGDCHPHLFIRTHEVVGRVNHHLYRFLGLVDFVLAHRPAVATEGEHVWERTLPSGVTVRFTMTRTGEVFTWLLEAAPPGGAFLTLFSGEVDRTGAAGRRQGKGSMTLNLTNLHAVFPMHRTTGVVSAGFEVTGAFRHVVVDAAGVAWAMDPTMMPPGMDGGALAALQQPRSGHYVFFREFGKGGSLKVKEQMVFLCPDNPQFKLADGVVVGRWYRYQDGARHGRSDGLVTGGQLPDQTPAWARAVGVTCEQGSTEMGWPDEAYWLWKAEDALGGTITGWSGGTGPSACDPALNPPTGDVPDLVDATHDFDFSQVTFTTSVDLSAPENQPYPFPGL